MHPGEIAEATHGSVADFDSPLTRQPSARSCRSLTRSSSASASPTGEPVPRDADYASLIESDVPIVVQHTRLDSRHPNIALLSTIAFAQS